jgi:hypothetical protein
MHVKVYAIDNGMISVNTLSFSSDTGRLLGKHGILSTCANYMINCFTLKKPVNVILW